MNHFTTLLIRNLLNNEHNLPEFESVLSEVFRQQLEEAVNDVLNYELEQFLGYERYRHTDKTDSRNGFKPDRTIDTKYGPITIKMPRDRLGLFASSLIPAYVRRTEGTERSVIDLFDLGLTNSEITEAVDRMFGAKVSKGTVSNITNRIISNIDSFKNRTLASEYAVIYIDATMMPLRRDTVQKEAVHIALGIRTDGTKEILDYSIAPNESKTNWKDMIEIIRPPRFRDVFFMYRETSVQNAVSVIALKSLKTSNRSIPQLIRPQHYLNWKNSMANGIESIQRSCSHSGTIPTCLPSMISLGKYEEASIRQT